MSSSVLTAELSRCNLITSGTFAAKRQRLKDHYTAAADQDLNSPGLIGVGSTGSYHTLLDPTRPRTDAFNFTGEDRMDEEEDNATPPIDEASLPVSDQLLSPSFSQSFREVKSRS
jgi:hypothetical protein